MGTLEVHEHNGRELTGLLVPIADDAEVGIGMFQNTRPPIVRERLELEVDQRLHNYVASAGTLVDHTRRTPDEYAGRRFFDEYEARRGPISDSAVARFVKGLRNYSLHRELPWVGNTVTIGRDDLGNLNQVRAEVQLSTGPLLAWDRWGWSSHWPLIMRVRPGNSWNPFQTWTRCRVNRI